MTKEEFEKIYNDPGCFKYTDDGFSIVYETFSKSLQWSDITELIAFKSDLMTTDRIDMHIAYGDKYFTISEDLPGWYQFINKIDEIFPSIPKNWEADVLKPPFAENKTILYQRDIKSTNES